MVEYKPRCIEQIIRDNLAVFGAVYINGPKWCGKTTTAKTFANSIADLSNPREKDILKAQAEVDITLVMKGEKPRLFDEWQVIPELWDAVRHDADTHEDEGRYLLTGSVNVDWGQVEHSGAGRIATVTMLPMSLFESGDSSGTVSLRGLFSGKKDVEGTSNYSVSDITALIVRGGWPKIIGKTPSAAHLLLKGYCDTLLERDISTVDGKQRDPVRMRMLLRSLARSESQSVENTHILSDVTGGTGVGMHINTLGDYLNALENLFVVMDLPAWCPKLRSKTAIRTSKVRHLIDPSIGAYFLNASVEDLLNDPWTLGFYFESMVVRDLRAYASAMGGEVLHYHDGDGLEADAIVHLWDGRWAAFEMKLPHKDIEEGAKNLLRLSEKIDASVENTPIFLAVITPHGAAYRRNDGVYVIPVGCLGP